MENRQVFLSLEESFEAYLR